MCHNQKVMTYRFSMQEVSKNYSEFNKKFKNKHCEKKIEMEKIQAHM